MLAATTPYLQLIKKLPLRPIQSDDELERAIETIDALLARPSLSRDENDYLDVLSDLVYKYEKAAHPLEPVPDSYMLKHLMEARDLSRAELHRQTRIPVSTIAAVLGGKRHLSRKQVATLSEFFNVSTDAFALPEKRGSRKKEASANGRPAISRTRKAKPTHRAKGKS